MIQINVNKYISEITNVPKEIIDLIFFNLKVEFDNNIISKIEITKIFYITAINNNSNYYSLVKYISQKNKLYILTGNLYEIIQIFKTHNLEFKLTKNYSTSLNPKYIAVLDTRKEQKELVETALKYKRCLIEAPTGFGKTRAIAEYIYQFLNSKVNILVLVSNVDLMYQMQNDLQNYLKVNIGIIGDNKLKIDNITVAIIDSLYYKLKNKSPTILNYLNSVNVFIADEAHEYANFSGAYVLNQLKNCEFYLGVSATLCIKNIKLLEGLIGPIMKSFSIKSAISSKTILKPIVEYIPVPKVEIPNNWENQNFSHKLYNQSYNLCIVNNNIRNQIIAKTTEKLILEEYFPLLILVKIVGTAGSKYSHSENIAEELKKRNIYLPIIHGKSTNRSKIIDQLKNKEILGAIATNKIMGTGIDISSLNAIILAAAGSSNKELIQNIGRCLRLNNENKQPKIIDFLDSTHFFQNQAEKRSKLIQELYN